MPHENRNQLVLVCQQLLAFAVVGAVALAAVGVVELRILPPGEAGQVGAPPASPADQALVAGAPVEPEVREVPLEPADPDKSGPHKSGTTPRKAQANQVRSERTPVSGFATVGVTWSPELGLDEDEVQVEVRTREEGRWSAWQPLEYDAEHSASPEETARSQVRDGTEPVVVGAVEDVQVRAATVAGESLEDPALQVIDPGTEAVTGPQQPAIRASGQPAAVNGSGQDAGVGAPGDADAARLAASISAPRPSIFTRAQWGADERLRDPRSLRYGTIRAGFVHHTVNANDYSKAQVPAIIRGIYAYHTQSRGWSDIGYNFLVDKFGRIWEGRYGGVRRPVVGAHTLGYNEESFAMSAIGNFETVQPRKAMLDAYGALFAWKLALHDVAADDTDQRMAGRRFHAINGHRDAGSTACPGRYLYAKLGAIRTRATRAQNGESPAPAPVEGTPLRPNLSGKAWPDLVVRDRSTKHALIVRTGGQVAFAKDVSGAADWPQAQLLAAPGDLDEDGDADLLAQTGVTRQVTRHELSGGTVVPAGRLGRLGGLDQLSGVGDFDEDGHVDVVGRRAASQKLFLFRGTGRGTVRKAQLLAEDWSGYDLTTGADDFDGDGHVDLLARRGQTLVLLPGTGPGRGLAAPRTLAGSWSQFDVITGGGDITGDGVPDLLARLTDDGRTFVYPGDGAGGWTPRLGGWGRFSGHRLLALGGQLGGNAQPDIVAVHRNGTLSTHLNTGRRNVDRIFDTGTTLAGIDLLLNVGDWNGDGRGDVMTRDAGSGTMHLRAGAAGNTLAAPVVAATGWGGVTRVGAVGDITGDGNPDLVGRNAAGVDQIYPGNGANGFKAPVARQAVEATEQLGLGWWDGDRTVDLGLRRGDGTLWVQPGDGSRVTQVADRLRRYDWVRGLGDVDGDDRPDLVVRAKRTGHLYLLPGRTHGFAPRRLIAPSFGGYDFGA